MSGEGANDYILKPFDDLEEVKIVLDITADKLSRWKQALQQSKKNTIK